MEKALRLGAADLSGLEAQSTSHEYEALRETIPKRHRTTSIRKGSEQSMNESRIRSNDIILKCIHATVKIAKIAVIALYCRVMHFIHSAVEELV